ncbi:NACHT domain-containing protein [Streptomyces sp. NPDC056361]|uniref:NACHT domain-containing protein n=1 Tax=Streptomyces sp. NPDC056361 TaxID=3345795 RepID=UPI0035D5D5DB
MAGQRGWGWPRLGISGGRQKTVVQAGHVDNIVIAVDVGGWFGLAAFAVVLLVAEPALPLPSGLGPGPATVGWLLLAALMAVDLAQRVLDRVRERREGAWRSEKNLAGAADTLAEDLCVRYRRDERWAQIHDPEPIEVAWREADGPPEPQLGSFLEYISKKPPQRLVILGGAGAGKSILVLRLAEGLLRERERLTARQGPVPVIVSLASWNPRQGLYHWIAGQVADDHPRACTPVSGAPPAGVALELLRSQRILPVLDGFDELPHGVREEAMRQLQASTKGGNPFVLTSRAEEYTEHALDQSRFARTEIVLCPLTDDAVAAYLNPGGRPKARWSAVLDRLAAADDESPEARLRMVLRVPLHLSLAREAYGTGSADPGELLEPGGFADIKDIERRLYDAYLDTVYSASHDIRAARGARDPEQARAWAGFLAARMKADNRQDLAWWRLDEDMPWRVRALGLVPPFALSTALVSSSVHGAPAWHARWGLPLWGAYALLCLVAFLYAATSAEGTEHRPPQEVVRLTGKRLREALGSRRGRVVGVLVAALLTAGWTAATAGDSGLWLWAMVAASLTTLQRCCRRLLLGAADPSLAPSPAALLRTDRQAVAVLGWLTPAGRPALFLLCLVPVGMLPFTPFADNTVVFTADERVIGFALDLAESLLIVFAPLLFAAWEHRARLVPLTLLLPPALLGLWAVHGTAEGFVDTGDWVLTVAGTLASWLLYVIAVSAWGRFQVARLYFAATGRLPLRIMAFLKDAHQRGVLRQSGGAYRFRHIELRDRLANTASADAHDATRSPGKRRQLAAGALALVLLAGAYTVIVKGAAQADAPPGPVRALPAACDLLEDEDVAALIDDAQERTLEQTPPTVLGRHSPSSCIVDEQSPFAPAVQIKLSAQVVTAFHTTGAVTMAKSTFDRFGMRDLGLTGGTARAIDGLGDEAELITGSQWIVEAGYPFPKVAKVIIRKGNAVIDVQYAEEFADLDRVTEVARILAGAALRKAGLTDAIALGGTRALKDLPRARIPAGDNRFVQYIGTPYQPVYGARWKGAERSVIRRIPGTALTARVPKYLKCVLDEHHELKPDDKANGISRCEGEEEAVRAELIPRLGIDARSHYCGARCDTKEVRVFQESIPGEAQSRWLKHGDATHYGIDHPEPGRYRMSLKQRWGFRGGDGRAHAYLLWIRVDVPEEQAELAQKIVNDAFAQTCAFPTADHPCVL